MTRARCLWIAVAWAALGASATAAAQQGAECAASEREAVGAARDAGAFDDLAPVDIAHSEVFEAAAAGLIAHVERCPHGQQAYVALQLAGRLFQRAGRPITASRVFRRAIETAEASGTEEPDVPALLVRIAVGGLRLELASAARRTGDLEAALTAYEAVSADRELAHADDHAAVALRADAAAVRAITLEQLGRSSEARDAYASAGVGGAHQQISLRYRAAAITGRLGGPAAMRAAMRALSRSAPGTEPSAGDFRVRIRWRIAQASRRDGAYDEGTLADVVHEYARRREPLPSRWGARWAAHAAFLLADAGARRLLAVPVAAQSPRADARLLRAVESVTATLGAVSDYGAERWTLASEVRASEVREHVARVLEASETPDDDERAATLHRLRCAAIAGYEQALDRLRAGVALRHSTRRALDRLADYDARLVAQCTGAEPDGAATPPFAREGLTRAGTRGLGSPSLATPD